MDKKGVLKYKDSNIITEFIEQLMAQNTVCLLISGPFPVVSREIRENGKTVLLSYEYARKERILCFIR